MTFKHMLETNVRYLPCEAKKSVRASTIMTILAHIYFTKYHIINAFHILYIVTCGELA